MCYVMMKDCFSTTTASVLLKSKLIETNTQPQFLQLKMFYVMSIPFIQIAFHKCFYFLNSGGWNYHSAMIASIYFGLVYHQVMNLSVFYSVLQTVFVLNDKECVKHSLPKWMQFWFITCLKLMILNAALYSHSEWHCLWEFIWINSRNMCLIVGSCQ